MDFWPTDDQLALAEGMRNVVAGRFGTDHLHAVEETEAVIDLDRWRELGEMGVFSLRADGLGVREAVLVFEELGRGLVPGPVVATHLAAALIDDAGSGGLVVGTFEPTGSPVLVEHATQVDHLLWFDDGDVRLVDPATLRFEPVGRPLDALTPVWTCADDPDSIRAGSTILATGADAVAVERVGVLLTAALQVGLAGAATDLANAYAKEREQFGRPIGSFQAVKHMLAEMFVHADVARSAVRAAACVLDDAGDLAPDRAVSGAKAVAGDAAIFCGRTGIQIHGGMGFTWEVDAQRYWKRAVVLDASFGTGEQHAVAVAEMLVGQAGA